jgi:hypothetical protein
VTRGAAAASASNGDQLASGQRFTAAWMDGTSGAIVARTAAGLAAKLEIAEQAGQ